jgi:hypothetical protein
MQHTPKPRYKFTITGGHIIKPIVVTSDKMAVDVLAFHVPSIVRASVKSDSFQSLRYYSPAHNAWYKIKWVDA